MKKMKTFLKNNLLPFFYSGTIMGSLALGYISHRVNKNKTNFEKMKENEGFKDSTRLDYDFYGLNWGVASDNMIKEKLDCGDILFLKYECEECLSLTDYFKCQLQHLRNTDENYDGLGLVFRSSEDDVDVYFNNFGRFERMKYADFLALPYFGEVSLRKISLSGDKTALGKRIYKVLKDFDLRELEESKELANDSVWKEFIMRTGIGIIDVRGIEEQLFMNKVDSLSPEFLRNEVRFNNKIIVRSRLNKELLAF